MSKQLAVIGKKPSFLKKVEPKTENNFAVGLGSDGLALPVLSIRGKGFRLRKGGHEESLKTVELKVILADSRKGVSKRFFEGEYNATETSAPRCSSIDGITPDVAEPVSELCNNCPNNVWGSAGRAGSSAKACGDYKRLIVIPLIREGVFIGPCVLDLSPTSFRTPKGADPREMQLKEYLALLAGNDAAPDTVVTKLSFSDDEFPRVIFTFDGYVDEEQYAAVQEAQDNQDVRDIVEGNSTEFEEAGAPLEAEPPVEKPKPAKKKAKVKKAEPEPVEEVEEAEVLDEVPTVEDDGEDDDLLADIEELLG